jgi:phospholipid-binding lipoprotein MlaA
MPIRPHTFVPFTLLAVLSGCASVGDPDPRDPLEPMNRAVSRFNDTVDNALFKPVAKGYKTVTPKPIRNGVRNFFSNLDDVTEFANNLLQFKIYDASSDLMRVAVNSSFGLLGIFDVASEMRLQKHNEDFGQTLGHWGIGSGPYLVLPILGSSSFRDGVGLYVDSSYIDPIYQLKDIASRNDALGIKFIGRRADLLDASTVMEEAALDKYEFIRDFYLDRREGQINGAHPPEQE